MSKVCRICGKEYEEGKDRACNLCIQDTDKYLRDHVNSYEFMEVMGTWQIIDKKPEEVKVPQKVVAKEVVKDIKQMSLMDLIAMR